jgi:hypothetical protein
MDSSTACGHCARSWRGTYRTATPNFAGEPSGGVTVSGVEIDRIKLWRPAGVLLVPSPPWAGQRREKPDEQWRRIRMAAVQRQRSRSGRRMRCQTTAAVPKRAVIRGAEAAVSTASGRMQRPRDGGSELRASGMEVRLLETGPCRSGSCAREPKRQRKHTALTCSGRPTGAVGCAQARAGRVPRSPKATPAGITCRANLTGRC